MTIQDHATRLTYLYAICMLCQGSILELQENFGIIGYPKIFHTDNGKEFTAKVVFKVLHKMSPTICTVAGRPRHPSDQGSIKSMNKLVKRILGTLLTLAGNVAGTSATCQPDSQMSALLADSAVSGRHKTNPDTIFFVDDCRHSPNFLYVPELHTKKSS
jgi:transposase InsO family protein